MGIWPSTFAFESVERIICTYSQQGKLHLASLDTAALILEEIETPYTDIQSLHAALGRVLFIAGSPTEIESVVLLSIWLRSNMKFCAVRAG